MPAQGSGVPGRHSEDSVRRIEVLCKELGMSTSKAEIALGMWHGLSMKQIASWLGKSRHTLDTHRKRLYNDARWPEIKCQVSTALAVERVLQTFGDQRPECS
jgi:FixJ family two-component response regulator